MTVSLKHAFTSAVADGADASLVRPSNWNAEHTLTLTADRLLGRRTSDGAAEEVTSSQALDFIGSTHGQIVYRGASAWAALAAGTARQVLRTGGASTNPDWSDQDFADPRDRFYAFADGMGSGATTDHWLSAAAGTGAAITAIAVGALNGIGFQRFDLGTTATGRVRYQSPDTACIKLGSGRARFQTKLAINQLSDGTDTYQARAGFQDVTTSTEPTDGCYFRYTHSVNSGKWEAVTRSNTTETAADTGVTAVAGTHQRFTVDVNAAGTSASFSIDGSVVATITTNIPTGSGRETGYAVVAARSAGTAALPSVIFDWAEVDIGFTTQR